jgi:hypothetical protein
MTHNKPSYALECLTSASDLVLPRSLGLFNVPATTPVIGFPKKTCIPKKLLRVKHFSAFVLKKRNPPGGESNPGLPLCYGEFLKF